MFKSLFNSIYLFFKYYYPILVASILCGVANNYPEYLWPFSIVGIFLFLLFIYNLKSNKTSFKAGIIFGIVFLSVSFLFVLEAYPLQWMGIDSRLFAFSLVALIWLVVPLFMSLPFGLFSFLTYKIFNSKFNYFIKAISIASFWVVAENLRALIFTVLFLGEPSIIYPHFTYHSLAYTLVWSNLFAKLLPLGGMYFLVFICIFVVSLIILQKNNKKWLVFFMIFLISIQFFNLNKKNEYLNNIKVSFFTTQFESVSLKIINKDYRYDLVNEIFNKYKSIDLYNSDIIIFPENTYFISQLLYKRVLNLKGFEHSIFLDSGKLQGGHLLTYLKDGNISVYEKQMLLPQGEYVSYWMKYFAFILNQKTWIDSFEKEKEGWRGNESFVYNDLELNTGIVSKIKIGGLLCYEIMSPLFYRQQSEHGANILVNIASNGIFPNSKTLLNQTISMGKVRAVENNRFLIQSTNKNSSFVISNKGEVLYKSNPNEVSIETISVPLIEEKTFYIKYGDLINLFSVVFSILVTLCLFSKPQRLL